MLPGLWHNDMKDLWEYDLRYRSSEIGPVVYPLGFPLPAPGSLAQGSKSHRLLRRNLIKLQLLNGPRLGLWRKDLMKEYKHANENRRTQISNTIKRQKINLVYNLERLGYEQHN